MTKAGAPSFWDPLRSHTKARIGLGRAGNAMPTKSLLEFQLAFAQAKDAVHSEADFGTIDEELAPQACIRVSSQAMTRAAYLQRPDLGRALSAESRSVLEECSGASAAELVFVVCDGLSAAAVMAHAAPVIRACLNGLQGWKVAPIVLASQGRVAIGDEIAHILGGQMVVVLIGERPGLSSPDSLGIYITWQPEPGTLDSRRNCISNIHAAGLAPAVGADKALWLIREASRLRLTGTALKEDFRALSGPEPGALLPSV